MCVIHSIYKSVESTLAGEALLPEICFEQALQWCLKCEWTRGTRGQTGDRIFYSPSHWRYGMQKMSLSYNTIVWARLMLTFALVSQSMCDLDQTSLNQTAFKVWPKRSEFAAKHWVLHTPSFCGFCRMRLILQPIWHLPWETSNLNWTEGKSRILFSFISTFRGSSPIQWGI